MSSPATALVSATNPSTDSELQVQQAQHQQDIANMAYALWQLRGCPEGSPEQDWIEAERQLHGEKIQSFSKTAAAVIAEDPPELGGVAKYEAFTGRMNALGPVGPRARDNVFLRRSIATYRLWRLPALRRWYDFQAVVELA